MSQDNIDNSYYDKLNKKIEKYDYTIMSVVSDEPDSPEHAAYCYTIGLSNFGYPEIMFADCYYDDVIAVADMIMEKIRKGDEFDIGNILETKSSNFKAIELLDGVKEELTLHAKLYFEVHRKNNQNYELLYMGKSDSFGIFPDEKIFVESKHVKRIFYKQSISNNLLISSSSLVMPELSTLQ